MSLRLRPRAAFVRPFLSASSLLSASLLLPASFALSASLLLSAPSAHAQSDDAVVVTATRTPQRASRVVSDFSVITRRDIEESGATTFAELLRGQPGVQMATNGGIGATTSMFLRGTNSDQVLVLVDGLRLGSATLGTTAFEHITPSQIERIEIVRGPMSSLYGADAIGGVIQIFTRSAQGPVAPRASAGFGSFNTQEYTAGVGGSVGDTSFNVQGAYLSSDGINAVANQTSFTFNPDEDSYRNSSVSARVAHRFTPDDELGATAYVTQGRNQFDGFPAGFDHRQRQTLQAYGLYSRNRIRPSWQSTVRAGYTEDDSKVTSGPSPDLFKTAQTQLIWQNDVSTSVGEWLVAAEYLDQSVTGTTRYAVTDRSVTSALGGYTGYWGPHTVQANLRYDDNSQFGGKTTGAIGYAYALAAGWRASVGYGTAFKAPSFNQLYFPGFGNPALEPETSKNLEAALRFERGAQTASVVAYSNQIDNLIVNALDPVTGLLFPQNVNQAQIDGVTLVYGFALGGWQVRANADFLSPENKQTGRELPRRARQTGTLNVTYTAGPWSVGGEWLLSGPRYDDVANTRVLGGYGLLNLFASYAFAKSWSVQARVNNVFDKEYELTRTFGTPGVNAFVALRYAPQ